MPTIDLDALQALFKAMDNGDLDHSAQDVIDAAFHLYNHGWQITRVSEPLPSLYEEAFAGPRPERFPAPQQAIEPWPPFGVDKLWIKRSGSPFEILSREEFLGVLHRMEGYVNARTSEGAALVLGDPSLATDRCRFTYEGRERSVLSYVIPV